jgi:hypothetical protein
MTAYVHESFLTSFLCLPLILSLMSYQVLGTNMKTGKAAMPDGVIGLHAGNSRGDGTYAVCCRQPQP